MLHISPLPSTGYPDFLLLLSLHFPPLPLENQKQVEVQSKDLEWLLSPFPSSDFLNGRELGRGQQELLNHHHTMTTRYWQRVLLMLHWRSRVSLGLIKGWPTTAILDSNATHSLFNLVKEAAIAEMYLGWWNFARTNRSNVFMTSFLVYFEISFSYV